MLFAPPEIEASSLTASIAPIKANLPRGRDAKPRVFYSFFCAEGKEDSLVAEGDLEASFLISY
jgi:hypothetical protein